MMTVYRDGQSGAEFLVPEKFKKRHKNGKHIFIAPNTGAYLTYQVRELPDARKASAKALLGALSREMKKKYGARIKSTGKVKANNLTGWRLHSRWVLKKGKQRRQIAQDETVFAQDGKVYRLGLVSPPKHYRQSRIVYDMVVESFELSPAKDKKKANDNQVRGPFTLPGGIRAGNENKYYEAYVDANGRLHLLDKKDDVIFIVEPTADAQPGDKTADKKAHKRGAKRDPGEEQDAEKNGERNVIGSTTRMDRGVVVREQKQGDEKPVVTARVSGENDRVRHRGYRGPFLRWGGGFGGEITDVVASDILVHEDGRVINLDAGRRSMSVYEREGDQTVRVELKGIGNILDLQEPKRRATRSIDAAGGRVFYTFRTSGYKVTIALRRQTEKEDDGE